MDKSEKEWLVNASEEAIRDRLADKVADGTLSEIEIDLVVFYLTTASSKMESAYKLLCRKMWLNSKPSSLKLTALERKLLQQLFPKTKPGRPASGTSTEALTLAVMENMYFAETGDKRLAREQVAAAAARMRGSCVVYGEQYDDGYTIIEDEQQTITTGTLRKILQRGREALSAEPSNRAKHISVSIAEQYDKQIIESALEEISRRKRDIK